MLMTRSDRIQPVKATTSAEPKPPQPLWIVGLIAVAICLAFLAIRLM
jgi:hypothetical protein